MFLFNTHNKAEKQRPFGSLYNKSVQQFIDGADECGATIHGYPLGNSDLLYSTSSLYVACINARGKAKRTIVLMVGINGQNQESTREKIKDWFEVAKLKTFNRLGSTTNFVFIHTQEKLFAPEDATLKNILKNHIYTKGTENILPITINGSLIGQQIKALLKKHTP